MGLSTNNFKANNKLMEGKIKWSSPSNIALIKYWGKKGIQLPCNPSISFTLKNAVTTTELSFSRLSKKLSELQVDYLFEGKKDKKFEQRILKFLNSIEDSFPFLNEYQLNFSSSNSFPHSAGIASSASSLSALSLCLCSLDKALNKNKYKNEDDFFKTASHYARLGSGSAGRSLFGGMATWGELSNDSNSSDNYASPFYDFHPKFKDFQDTIILVDKNEKSVSSTMGHQLMNNHPYKEMRYSEASANLANLMDALKKGDLESFGEIVEREALSLHGLMMTSNPPFILMKGKTLTLIEEIQAFRKNSKVPVWFTLDAGPNIHLLYPKEVNEKVKNFLNEKVLKVLGEESWIHDEVGNGPTKLLEEIKGLD